jgi:hypothetical protein
MLLISIVAAAKFAAEQKTEFEQVVAQLDTPEKVNEWLSENLAYDQELFDKLVGVRGITEQDFWQNFIRLPIETYFDRKGLCHDAANFAGHALKKAGYKVQIVTIRRTTATKSGSRYHTVCAVKRDGKWWVLGDTRAKGSRVRKEIAGPFDNIGELAKYTADGNLKEYDTQDRRKGF